MQIAHRELCHARSISLDEKDFSDRLFPAHNRGVPLHARRYQRGETATEDASFRQLAGMTCRRF